MTDILYLKRIVHVFHSKHVVDTERHMLYPCPQEAYSQVGEVGAQVIGTFSG